MTEMNSLKTVFFSNGSILKTFSLWCGLTRSDFGTILPANTCFVTASVSSKHFANPPYNAKQYNYTHEKNCNAVTISSDILLFWLSFSSSGLWVLEISFACMQ